MGTHAIALLTIVVAGMLLMTAATARDPSGCQGFVNTIAPYSDAPKLIRSVANGKLFQAGGPNDTFSIVHVWGTPYERGLAQGKLLTTELNNIGPMVTEYLESAARSAVPWLPQAIVDDIVAYGVPFVLQLNVNATRPFTPAQYLDEMRGIADGAGVSVEVIENLNAIPEITKAACTVVGANKKSTADGGIMHLRALDFDPNFPIANFPQVTVYHESDGSAFANVGWTGMVGVLTGVSNVIGIGEKLWKNHTKGIESVYGEPWMFVLRDALTAKNMSQALDRIQNANRTCAIHVGIGDSTSNTFNGLTIAARAYDVYNWTSLNWTGHPIIQDVFYWDKEEQPSYNPCLGELLLEYDGVIDAELLTHSIAPVHETGNMHCVGFDYANQVMWIANARKPSLEQHNETMANAFNRQFTRVDLNSLWAEVAPPQ